MRKSLMIASIVAAVVAGLLAPASAPADASRCQQIEAALRSSGEELGYTGAELDNYVRQGSAKCWEEVAAEERVAAEVAAEERRQDEALEAEEAAKTAERQREKREAREVRREERREAERRRREWAHKPTVTRYKARVLLARALRKADAGLFWIDCRHGRINRTHWACKVSLFYRCLRGRAQVIGLGYREGEAMYRVHFGRFRQCHV